MMYLIGFLRQVAVDYDISCCFIFDVMVHLLTHIPTTGVCLKGMRQRRPHYYNMIPSGHFTGTKPSFQRQHQRQQRAGD